MSEKNDPYDARPALIDLLIDEQAGSSWVYLEAVAEAAAETVRPLFEAGNWTWAGASNGIPTVTEIRSVYLDLAGRLLNDPDLTAIESGRLTVHKIRVADGEWEQLRFGVRVGTAWKDDLDRLLQDGWAPCPAGIFYGFHDSAHSRCRVLGQADA